MSAHFSPEFGRFRHRLGDPKSDHASKSVTSLVPLVATRSLQIGERGAEVEVDHVTIAHEGRDRFHAGGLGLGNAVISQSEMNDFEVNFGCVQITRDGRFGIETDFRRDHDE